MLKILLKNRNPTNPIEDEGNSFIFYIIFKNKLYKNTEELITLKSKKNNVIRGIRFPFN